MRVSVVIPHLNQPRALAACLASLAAGSRQPDEVIVVDNGSDAPPGPLPPEVVLLHEPTPGPGPARNRGIAAARGDVVAFTDADCVADHGWLAAMVAQMQQDPQVAILAGAVDIAWTDPRRPTAVEAYESLYAFRVAQYVARQGFGPTCNLAVRRAVLSDVGGFGGLEIAEDRDWCHRARARGHRLVHAPGMIVRHPARASAAALMLKWDRLIAHDFEALHQRGQAARLAWVAKALALPLSVPVEALRCIFSPRLPGRRAGFAAAGMMARVRLHRARRMLWLAAGGDAARLRAGWNRQG